MSAPPHTGVARVLALLEVGRAHSAAGAGLAVWVGGHLAGASWSWRWLVPMGVAFCLSMAGNADNDAHDAPLDAINRPTRPLPRGALTVGAARRFARLMAALALLLALPGGLVSLLGSVAAIGGFALYTRRLKGIPLLGNAVVGTLASMAMGYGGLLAGNVLQVILPGAAFGAFFTGRELLKTLYDLPGDQAFGIPTAATRWGVRPTLRAATALCGGAVGLLWQALGPWAGLGGGVVLAGVLAPLWQAPADRGRAATVLGATKVVGLLALLALALLSAPKR